MTRYLTVEDVADRYRTSVKAIHDLTRTNRIPFSKRKGMRRVLFNPEHLDRWDAGAPLHVVDLVDGSKLVVPIDLVADAA